MECFAFGVGIVRFASLETSFHAQTISHGRDAILRVRDKSLILNMILQLWADMKYHVPTGIFRRRRAVFVSVPPSFYPLTHENPSLQLTERTVPLVCLWFVQQTERTVPLVCSTPEKGEMRRVGGDGVGWKGNRLLALVGVGQPILLLPESGRL